jgi:hypothetical protein
MTPELLESPKNSFWPNAFRAGAAMSHFVYDEVWAHGAPWAASFADGESFEYF